MLEIHASKIGNVAILDVQGRIDAINCGDLQQAIDGVITDGDENNLLLRFAEVNYLSAAALRVLRTLMQKTKVVRIVEPSDRVIEVMQITGLDAIYELYATMTEALHQANPVVNAHTHLELGWLKANLPDITGRDFVPWIKEAITIPFQNLPPNWEMKFSDAVEAGIREMRESGITTVGDISSTGLSIEPLLKSGLKGVVYIEVLGVDPEQAEARFERLKDLIEKWLPHMRKGLQLGISPHTPFSLSRELWDKVLAYAKEKNLPLCIHVAESVAETQYLQDGTGALVDLYPERQFSAPKLSPIAYLEELGALALKPLLVHAIHVSDEDIALIKKYGCQVVHCPRSNLRLRCGRMPLEKYLAADIPVLIGTDSLVSSPSLNIFDEIEVAVALHHDKVSPETILNMAHQAIQT